MSDNNEHLFNERTARLAIMYEKEKFELSKGERSFCTAGVRYDLPTFNTITRRRSEVVDAVEKIKNEHYIAKCQKRLRDTLTDEQSAKVTYTAPMMYEIIFMIADKVKEVLGKSNVKDTISDGRAMNDLESAFVEAYYESCKLSERDEVRYMAEYLYDDLKDAVEMLKNSLRLSIDMYSGENLRELLATIYMIWCFAKVADSVDCEITDFVKEAYERMLSEKKRIDYSRLNRFRTGLRVMIWAEAILRKFDIDVKSMKLSSNSEAWMKTIHDRCMRCNPKEYYELMLS